MGHFLSLHDLLSYPTTIATYRKGLSKAGHKQATQLPKVMALFHCIHLPKMVRLLKSDERERNLRTYSSGRMSFSLFILVFMTEHKGRFMLLQTSTYIVKLSFIHTPVEFFNMALFRKSAFNIDALCIEVSLRPLHVGKVNMG